MEAIQSKQLAFFYVNPIGIPFPFGKSVPPTKEALMSLLFKMIYSSFCGRNNQLSEPKYSCMDIEGSISPAQQEIIYNQTIDD